jgi:hypothetical protein
MPMIHLTLNSGKSNPQPRRVFVPELTDLIRPFLDNGGGTFPRPYGAYRIETDVTETGVGFDYYKGETPIALCLGTWSAEVAEEYWAEIEAVFYEVTDLCPEIFWAKRPPEAPAAVPWLATLLLPQFFVEVRSDSPDVSFLNVSEAAFFWVAHDLVHS